MERLQAERLAWQILTKALGRDGLPVLEIDAVGPHISALTNDLLSVCFGPSFSVELVTQEAKADKGMKESFSLLVTDNEREAAPRDVSDLSDGEQVIVGEALANAISLYVNRRSPFPMRTTWRDETTGALDPENSVRYIGMLRKVLVLGGYSHIFYVSQNPETSALADVQIAVGAGTARILLPPFSHEMVAA